MQSKKEHTRFQNTSFSPQAKGENIFLQKMTAVCSLCLYAVACVTALLLTLFVLMFTFVKLYPQEIRQRISHELQQATGMELQFSGIDMALLPLPALSFADVQLDHKDFSLQVAYATLRPDVLPLFQGRVSLGDISLWRPHFLLKQGLASSAPNKAAPLASSVTTSTLGQTTTAADAPVVSSKSSAEQLPHPSQQAMEHVGAIVEAFLQDFSQQVPEFLYGSSVEILHGSVLLDQENWSMKCDSLHTHVELGVLGALDGTIRFDVASFFIQDQVFAKVQAFNLTLGGDLDDRLTVHVQSKGSMENLLEQTEVDIALTYTLQDSLTQVMSRVLPLSEKNQAQGRASLQGQWSIKTDLVWHDVPIPVHSSGFVRGNLQNTLHIQNMKGQLGEDSLTLNAAVHLQDLSNPTVDGHIAISQFSLTQWFGFARHMPPGLQHVLHRISGDLDFAITKDGLEVPRLKAQAAEGDFTGKGGVKSWSKAVVFLDLHAPLLYLKKVYAEAEGLKPSPLSFLHKPLTPEPGSPEAQADSGPDSISVDYDINVSADTVMAWELPIKTFHFRVYPMGLDEKTFDKKHENAAVLGFKAKDFFGGRAEGKAILYRNANDVSAYDISALLRNVRAQRPVERLIGRALFDGRMSADASVTSEGVYAGEFLVALAGSASLRVENGHFYGRSKQKVPFKLMTAAGTVRGQNDAKVSGAQWPPKLEYKGQWRASLDTKDISAKSTWNGSLEFIDEDYGTVSLSDIPGSVQVTFSPELTSLPNSTEVHFSTLLSLNTTKGIVSLAKAKGTVPSLANMQASGFGELNFSKDIVWKATVATKTNALSQVLGALDDEGRPLLPPTAPQNATLSANMSYAKSLLRLDSLAMQVQDMKISGKLQRTFTAKPAWTFDLFADVFDYDVLFGKKKKSSSAKNALGSSVIPATAQSERPLSWRWLEDFNAKGTVRMGTYRMNKVQVQDVVAPVKISAATLDCTPTKAKFYGGDALINFKGTVKDAALHSQLGVVTKGANLFALSEDLQLETVIAGTADFWISAQGPIRYSRDIPSAFDGTWRLQVGTGFLQSRDKKGKLTGSPTYIKFFRDMGVITKGVLESHKFELRGDGLKALGHGKVDLVKDTLDMNLVVSTGGLSDIPVRFYGDLSDPQRDVHTGAVLLSALGSLGMGVFDIIGGIFGAFFSLFK